MSKFQELLMAGLIAAIATGAVAGIVVWKVATRQYEAVARQLQAQSAKIQTVGDEIARTAGEFKRLDGALKTTETTLREVKDQVALVGTRNGMAQINTLVEAANKTLAEIKQATTPEQARAALAPLGTRLDAANKTLAALAPLDAKLDATQAALAALQTRLNGKLDDALKSLAAIGKTTDTLKGNGADTARLGEAAKPLAAIKESVDAIRSVADTHAAKLDAAAKSLAALDISVKQGFTDVESKQAEAMKAVAKPDIAPPQPPKSRQDLVVFYVSMAAKATASPAPAAPLTTSAIGLTPPAPPPFVVRFERLGGVDDEGQTKVIVGKLRDIVKGHSGCTIAVAGHADTIGGDRKNYELSRRRANEVADKLKTAFKAESIPVTETRWGERRLKEWTPDGVARAANRRVDVAVSCEK